MHMYIYMYVYITIYMMCMYNKTNIHVYIYICVYTCAILCQTITKIRRCHSPRNRRTTRHQVRAPHRKAGECGRSAWQLPPQRQLWMLLLLMMRLRLLLQALSPSCCRHGIQCHRCACRQRLPPPPGRMPLLLLLRMRLLLQALQSARLVYQHLHQGEPCLQPHLPITSPYAHPDVVYAFPIPP